MRMWAKGTLGATLLTASVVALGAGPALADVTSGDGSVLGGNQVNAPVSVPLDLSGNAIAAVGHAVAGSKGGSSVVGSSGYAGGGHSITSGRHSIGGGNQINAPVNAPANICGNAVGVIGGSLAGCEGGARMSGSGYAGSGYAGSGYAGGGHSITSGRHSIGGGNQINAPVNAPMNICGNAAALLGDALAGCRGGAGVSGGGYAGGGYAQTSGRHSILGGNQVDAPVNAPTNICGNAIGNAIAGCEGGSQVVGGAHGYAGGGYAQTSGRHSILGGNQVHAPVNAPVDVCGNAVAVLGDAAAGCSGHLSYVGAGYPGADHTSGFGSIGGGNQIYAPVYAPVNACGNAAAVIGGAAGSCGADDYCPEPYSARSYQRMGDVSGGKTIKRLAAKVKPGPHARAHRLVQPQSAGLPATLGVPSVGGPPKGIPPVGKPVTDLVPVKIAAAESPADSPSGAIVALVLGCMLAASAGTVSLTRRLRRR
jgi:hypothetical protein